MISLGQNPGSCFLKSKLLNLGHFYKGVPFKKNTIPLKKDGPADKCIFINLKNEEDI